MCKKHLRIWCLHYSTQQTLIWVLPLLEFTNMTYKYLLFKSVTLKSLVRFYFCDAAAIKQLRCSGGGGGKPVWKEG